MTGEGLGVDVVVEIEVGLEVVPVVEEVGTATELVSTEATSDEVDTSA